MTDTPHAPNTAANASSGIPSRMRAAVHRRYGAPDVIGTEVIPTPTPEPNQVLVQVAASALNPYDWHLVRGIPYIVRAQSGVRTPKHPVVGADFAGTVVATGGDVTDFAPGDRVFGGAVGTCAEYTAAKETSIAHIPAGSGFAEAAGLTMAGCTALQAVRDTAAVGSGDRVLVNGASGGVGLLAVQIAKAQGAEVTAVCSSRNEELVRSAGADHVVDYSTRDFLDTEVRYDAVIDTVMTRSPREVTAIMSDDGRYALVGALEIGNWIGPIAMWLRPMLASIGKTQKLGVTMATEPRSDLELLAAMAERGEIRTIVDSTYPLDETAAALAHVEEGHARGKVIVDVAGG